MSDTETIFDVNATRRGWTVFTKGWPDRLVVNEHGGVFFVEIKREDEPLRPHQYRVMSMLEACGIKVYISINGSADDDKIVPLDEWLVSPSNRGRPASPGTISRATARSYGYKLRVLLKEIELAQNTPAFPKERLDQLVARSQYLAHKLDRHWTGPDTVLMKDIKELEIASDKDLAAMQALVAAAPTTMKDPNEVAARLGVTRKAAEIELMNRQALKEAAEQDALVLKAAREKFGGDNEGPKQATDAPSEAGGADRDK